MLELADYIHAVETAASPYMLPNPEGLYLAGQCEPVLYKDRPYFYAGKDEGVVAKPIPINWSEPLRDDVYNSQAELVVVKKQLPYLKSEGQYSLRSRNLIVEIIDHLIRTHARWSGSQSAPKAGMKATNAHAAIRPFLREEFQRSGVTVEGVIQKQELDFVAGHYWKTQRPVAVEVDPVDEDGVARVTEEDKQNFLTSIDICDSIMLQVNDLVQQLLDFLGQDRWIMHFMKVNNTQVTVEKTIDYRIYSWMMEHGRDLDD